MKKFLLTFLFLFPANAFSQVAYDAFTDGGDNGGVTTSLSWNHTSTGSNRVGFVMCSGDALSGNDDLSAPTWGGTTMTIVDKVTAPIEDGSTQRFTYLYIIVGQTSGSQNIVASIGSTHYLVCASVSYTGAAQSGQPVEHVQNKSALLMETSQSLTTTLTTTVDNSWMILGEFAYSGSNPTAGSGTTKRGNNATYGFPGFFDSGGPISPAGSYSETTSLTGTTLTGTVHIAASIKPAAGGGGGTNSHGLLTMGVGK